MQIRMHAHLPNGMRRGFRLDVKNLTARIPVYRPKLPCVEKAHSISQRDRQRLRRTVIDYRRNVEKIGFAADREFDVVPASARDRVAS
jgi:hypothetical protein